jgi:heme exporter protein D
MAEFLAMGGYGFYVWTAYALALAVLAGMVVQSLLWHRRLVRRIRRQSASRDPADGPLTSKRPGTTSARERSS